MTAEPQPLEGDAEEEPPIYAPPSDGALRQGEFLSGLKIKKLLLDSVKEGDELRLVAQEHPYAIVVSQDCDLEQDYKLRCSGAAEPARLLPSVLLCEVFTAEQLKGRDLKSDMWKRVRINKDERYHFFEGVPAEADRVGTGLPELGVDFKRYFTVPTDELYLRIESGKVQRRCRLVSPYLEHVSTRFAYYQFRVALPRDHESVSET